MEIKNKKQKAKSKETFEIEFNDEMSAEKANLINNLVSALKDSLLRVVDKFRSNINKRSQSYVDNLRELENYYKKKIDEAKLPFTKRRYEKELKKILELEKQHIDNHDEREYNLIDKIIDCVGYTVLVTVFGLITKKVVKTLI